MICPDNHAGDAEVLAHSQGSCECFIALFQVEKDESDHNWLWDSVLAVCGVGILAYGMPFPSSEPYACAYFGPTPFSLPPAQEGGVIEQSRRVGILDVLDQS